MRSQGACEDFIIRRVCFDDTHDAPREYDMR
jgi:hypothetical protein